MASVAKREWSYKDEKRSAYVVRYKQGGKHCSRQFNLKEAEGVSSKNGAPAVPPRDMRLLRTDGMVRPQALP